MIHRASLVLLSATTLLACAYDGAPVVTPTVAATDALAEPPVPTGTLVWTTDTSGVRETWTLDDAGNPLHQSPGVLVAARGGVWAWRQETQPVTTHPCSTYDDDGNEVAATTPSEPGTGMQAGLVRLGGADTLDVVAVTEGGQAEVDPSVDLLATVGPYLFVQETLYVLGFGVRTRPAHGLRIAWALHIDCAGLRCKLLSRPTFVGLHTRAAWRGRREPQDVEAPAGGP